MTVELGTRNGAATMVLRTTEPADVLTVPPVSLVSAAEPWSRRDLTGFAAVTALGAGLLGVSYLGVSAEVHLKDQVPFFDFGLAGLLVGAVGGFRWLAAGLGAVRARKAAVLALVRSRFGQAGLGTSAGPSHRYVAGGRMTRYHRPGCSLVAGKDVTAATPAEHSAAGRRPCGMCAP